jgi:hypothetical protein
MVENGRVKMGDHNSCHDCNSTGRLSKEIQAFSTLIEVLHNGWEFIRQLPHLILHRW